MKTLLTLTAALLMFCGCSRYPISYPMIITKVEKVKYGENVWFENAINYEESYIITITNIYSVGDTIR